MEGNIFWRMVNAADSPFYKVKSWINQFTASDARLGCETPAPVDTKSVISVTGRGHRSVGEHAGNNYLVEADGCPPDVVDFSETVDQQRDDKSLQQRAGMIDDTERSFAFHAELSRLSMTCTANSKDRGFYSHLPGRHFGPSVDETRQRSASRPALLQKRISLASVVSKDNEYYQQNRKVEKQEHTFSRAVSVSSSMTTIKGHATVVDDERTNGKFRNYSIQLHHVVIDSYEETSGSYADGKQCFGLESKVSKATPNGDIVGRLKLSLQYFGTSKVLRVIVLRATNLKAKKGRVFPRLAIRFGNLGKKQKKISLRKVKAQQDVAFNEAAFFDDIDEEEIDVLTLTVSILNKERVFRFTKCLGEMVIPIYKYNISMDTNIWGNLRQKCASAKVPENLDVGDESDLEIFRDDRSISASVAARVHAVHPSGLKSFDLETGAVKWKDFILRFPSLPVMDIDGNVWGSDGSNLASYTSDGKLIMTISLNPKMRPLFGNNPQNIHELKEAITTLINVSRGHHVFSVHQIKFLHGRTGGGVVSEDFLLLVSESGEISTLNTDGVPMASIHLKGNVERDNGTFLPTAPPVVNGNRFYVLTEFVPDTENYSEGVLGLQRLYAIDTFHSMSDRMEVKWYANFERERSYSNTSKSGHSNRKPEALKNKLIRKVQDPAEMMPSMLWDKDTNTVFIALPPPALSATDAATQFIGVKDDGNDSAFVFRSYMPVVNFALFEVNFQPPSNAVPQLWGSLPDGKLVAFTKTGKIDRQFDLSDVFKTNFTITTKLSITRHRNYEEDLLIFGIRVKQSTTGFVDFANQFGVHDVNVTSYIVAIDTPENKNEISKDPGMPVMWMVPCPESSVPYGQIVGVPAAGNRSKDQLIVFSQIEGKFGKVFSIADR